MSGCAVNQYQDVSLTNHEKDIALLTAAYEGNTQEAKRQLANGADVNAKDKDYRHETSLQYAAQEGHSKIAELLIANGANVNAKSIWKWRNTIAICCSRKPQKNH